MRLDVLDDLLNHKENRTRNQLKKVKQNQKKSFENADSYLRDGLYFSAYIQTEGMLTEHFKELKKFEEPVSYLAYHNYEIIIQELKKEDSLSQLETELVNNCENRLRNIAKYNSDIVNDYLNAQK